MNIVELFARFGVKTDEVKLKSFNKQVKGVSQQIVKAIGLTAGTAGMVMAFKKMSVSAMQTSVALTNLSRKTGLSVEQLQKMQGSAVIVSSKEIQDINAANKELYKISTTGKSLAMIFGGELVKSVGQIAAKFNKFIKDNPHFIDQVRTVAKNIGQVVIASAKFVKTLYSLIDKTIGWGKALKIIAVIWAAMKIMGWIPSIMSVAGSIGTIIGVLKSLAVVVYSSVVPSIYAWGVALWSSGIAEVILAVTAVVVGLLLVLEDLWVFFKGGDSVTGVIVNSFKKMGAVFGQSITGMKNKIKELGKELKESFIKNFNALKNSGIIKFFQELGGEVISGVIEHFKTLWKLLGNIGQLVLSVFKLDKKGIKEAIDGMKTNVGNLKNNALNTSKNVVGTVARGANTVTTSVVNNFNGAVNRDTVDRATQKTVGTINANYSQYQAMQPQLGY